jgi:hypothetical protein
LSPERLIKSARELEMAKTFPASSIITAGPPLRNRKRSKMNSFGSSRAKGKRKGLLGISTASHGCLRLASRNSNLLI